VGPGLRGDNSVHWTTFEVIVTGVDAASGATLATIATHYGDVSQQPRCMGNVVAEKPAICADHRVHIHPAAQAGADAPWVLTAVEGGAFTIHESGRAAGCAAYLSASAACGTSALVLAPADGSSLQEWVLESADPVPSPSPSPSPPPPLAGQAPSLNASSVTASSAILTVTPPPGGCVPVLYKVSHAPANSIEGPSVATVPAGAHVTTLAGNLVTGQTYVGTAVGVCADGTRTPPSAPVTFVPAPPGGGGLASCLPGLLPLGTPTPGATGASGVAWSTCCSGFTGDIYSSPSSSTGGLCQRAAYCCCLGEGADSELVPGGEFETGGSVVGNGAGDCCSDSCASGTVNGRATSCRCSA
jgi:hypothetical protein